MKCPEGYNLNKHEKGCKFIAKALKKTFKDTGCYQTETVGCHDNGPFIYFSNCAKSSTASNHAAVCIRNGEYSSKLYF